MPDKPVKSPKPESLDEIVSRSAIAIADQIQTAASWDASEMQLQIEAAGALKEFAKRAQIKLEGRHNITVATGRPDSVYGSVIVEYKKPGTLSSSRDAAANKALIVQLKQRFYDMNREENRNWGSMFGAGTDGKYFIFLRFRDDKWTDQEPLEVDRYSTERFLWALYNLGQKGKPYQPGHLNADFGSDSPLAREGVRTLYKEMLATENPKAQVFFNQWKILFGEVCGYDVENLSDKLKKLAEFYIEDGKPQPAPLLFAVHTYYAIFIKLVAAEIVSFFNPWMPRRVEKLQSATSPGKLKKELEELERGGIFHQMGITNFLEGDLFSWYLAVWSEPIEALVRKMISKLDEYNPGTFSEDPAQSRDLLKKLYQQLFPKSVRHNLGEYYTPDWLAEHVLNELGCEGDPDKRLLDPACGSGTFLVMAINRIRRWYDLNREKCAYDEGELLKKILANVIGFDLNPLAVMAARTNYLVAIKELIRHVDSVEIPVYLCDSILTPSQVGSHAAQVSFLTETGAHYDPSNPPVAVRTAAGIFLVEAGIAQSREKTAKYAEVLEFCVRNKYGTEDFLRRCHEEGLPTSERDLHSSFYSRLVKLDRESKNGIWARIIKNNFAPLFVGKVDYIAGNPPWVAWEDLPTEYRAETEAIWKEYGLYEHKGMKARLAAANDDISILMTYVAVDRFLREGGRLGFVITQSVFQSVGGQGFRRFRTPDSELALQSVHDFVKVRPFEAAQNRTVTFTILKGRPTQYPVPYWEWTRTGTARTLGESSFAQARKRLSVDAKLARPSDKDRQDSGWEIYSPGQEVPDKLRGPSDYTARKGVCTSANSVYWVMCRATMPSGLVMVENLSTIGKKKTHKQNKAIEPDLIFPLLRGRDVKQWQAVPSLHMILPQVPGVGKTAIPLKEMRRQFPHALEFLGEFEKVLRERKEWKKLLEPLGEPFYALYAVGSYTFAPWKVVFKEIATSIQAAVVSTSRFGDLGQKLIIPDHKLVLVPAGSRREAHYLCAVLNSGFVNRAAMSSMVGTQISTHLFRSIAVPTFDERDDLHRSLARMSVDLHRATGSGDSSQIEHLSKDLEGLMPRLWR